jgi:hypothetical protein
VATFSFDDLQGMNFSSFYKGTCKGVLTKAHIDDGDGTFKEGHAVALVGFNDSYLVFINSWGNEWANEGYFLVEPGALDFEFIDVSYFVSDLTENDRRNFKRYQDNLNK